MGMGEPIAVFALRGKRDQISGTIAHYERLLREAEHDLAHINASPRLFEAMGEAADLQPYVDLNRVLRRGETTKICMECATALQSLVVLKPGQVLSPARHTVSGPG